MAEVIVRPPTYQELQERVAALEELVEELRTGGAVVRAMMEKFCQQYRPVTSVLDSTEQLTTAQLVKSMTAIVPGIRELNVVNAMVTAGFSFANVDGDFYWLLRSV